MLLFGLTWVFGAFTIRGGPNYFKYLFVGFNSLQGLFVFVFFVVFAKQTQDLWLQICGCKERKKREKFLTAITGIAPPKRDRLGLDENADRLKPMEEENIEARLGMTTFDITYAVQPTQFDILLNSDRSFRDTEVEEEPVLSRINEEPCEQGEGSRGGSEQGEGLQGPLDQQGLSEKEVLEKQLDFEFSAPELHHSQDHKSNILNERSRCLTGHSPTHSLDSAQNAEIMSTADSGILMDKRKNSPSPPLQDLQHPQSGSTPRHIYSVSGIGYISAESSMETLPQQEEDCYKPHKGEPITLAPSLRPRAVPNEYATINVENPCP